MKFIALVIPAGNAAAVAVPEKVVEALGAGARPPVKIEIHGHTWRSRIMPMNGKNLIGISAANRSASGVKLGDQIEVSVEVDAEPRVVALPADLEAALARSKKARAAFETLPFGLKRKHVTEVEKAKSEATRLRRIEKLLAELNSAA